MKNEDGRDNSSNYDSRNDSVFGGAISRRKAISTAGKVAIGVVVAAAIGGGAYAAYDYLNTSSSPNITEVKLGADLPLTGSLSGFGTEANAAFNMAVDDVNSAGGLKIGNKSYPVKLIVYDDTSSTSVATSNVQRLAQVDQVHAMLSVISFLTLAAAASAERYTIPHVGGIGSAAAITQHGYKYTFELYPSAPNQVAYNQEILATMTGANQVKTTAILYDTNDVGIEWANGWRNTAAALGWQVVSDQQFSPNQSDYTPYVLKLAQANPDVLAICNQFAPDAITIIQNMKQQNFRPKGFMVGPGSDNSWPTALGKDGDYVLLPGNAYAATENSTLNTNLVNKYNSIRSNYKAGPPVNVGYDYTQAMVALQGISNAGSVDPVKVRNAIASINLTDTVLGTVKFDSTGRAILDLLMVQWQNETQVIVYPSPQATSQLWYPAPTWSQGEVPTPVTLPPNITLSTITTSVAAPSSSSTTSAAASSS